MTASLVVGSSIVMTVADAIVNAGGFLGVAKHGI
jgi:hypothetical protein